MNYVYNEMLFGVTLFLFFSLDFYVIVNLSIMDLFVNWI